jgi:uncharacterized heparinase superfamily protein
MPSLLYYLQRASEQPFRETLTQARDLASVRIRSVIQPACDRIFKKVFTADDILRISGFSSKAELAIRIKTRHWPSIELQQEGATRHAEQVLKTMTAPAWHTDVRTGYQWDSSLHYRKIPLSPSGGVDIKVPWELSRCHHLVTLGIAYQETQAERYAGEFVNQVSDWISQNPVRYGVNWVSPMETGIRAVNWSWALALMRTAEAVDEHFLADLLTSLWEHVQFIKANLEFREGWVNNGKCRLNSNHYLCDLAGILTVALLFPELQLVNEGRFAQRELEIEILEQTTGDGVDYEHSTAYHRFVHEIFGYCFDLLKKCGSNVNDRAIARLVQMESFSAACLHNDATLAQIGDNDSGHLLKHVSIASTTTNQSEPFEAAGFYSMRTSDTHVLVSAARVGMRGFGSHSHNDILSFEYWHSGSPWIVDPGTYAYLPDIEARNWFRSTAAHNTVRVDREEIRPYHTEAIFQMVDAANVRVVQWSSDRNRDVLEAEHTGYMRLPQGITHRRRLDFDKSNGRLSIIDSLEGSGQHLFEWHFQVHPDVHAERSSSSQEFVLSCKGRRVRLSFRAGPTDLKTIPGWYSPEYGIRKPATTVVAEIQAGAPISAMIVIEPC